MPPAFAAKSTLCDQSLSPTSKSNGWKEVGVDTGAVNGRRGGCVGDRGAATAIEEDQGVQNRSTRGVSLGEREVEDAAGAWVACFARTLVFPLSPVTLGMPSAPSSPSCKEGDSIGKSSCGGNKDTVDCGAAIEPSSEMGDEVQASERALLRK